MKKQKSNNCHIILNLEISAAHELLARRSLLIGLNKCNIRPYRPIIRCADCQLYGYTVMNCRRDPICDKCLRGHCTTECPFVNVPSQYRCSNCYNMDNYTKHTADSTMCPIYQSQLADRRKFTWTA